jgi:hypothetical protein
VTECAQTARKHTYGAHPKGRAGRAVAAALWLPLLLLLLCDAVLLLLLLLRHYLYVSLFVDSLLCI